MESSLLSTARTHSGLLQQVWIWDDVGCALEETPLKGFG